MVTAPGDLQARRQRHLLRLAEEQHRRLPQPVGDPRRRSTSQTYVGHHPPRTTASSASSAGSCDPGPRPGLPDAGARACSRSPRCSPRRSRSLRRIARPHVGRRRASRSRLSPMVLFLGSTVSPSGVEIGAAIGVWVQRRGARRGGDDRRRPEARRPARHRDVHPRALPRAVTALARGDRARAAHPHDARRSRSRSLKSRRVWIWGGVARRSARRSSSGGTSTATPLSHFVGTPVHASAPQLLKTSFGKSGEMLREMVGVFGWLDTRAPGVTFFIWVSRSAASRRWRSPLASTRFVWRCSPRPRSTVVAARPRRSRAARTRPASSGRAATRCRSRSASRSSPGIGVGSAERRQRLGRRLGVVLVVGLAVAQFLAFAAGPAPLRRRGRWSAVVLLRRAAGRRRSRRCCSIVGFAHRDRRRALVDRARADGALPPRRRRRTGRGPRPCRRQPALDVERCTGDCVRAPRVRVVVVDYNGGDLTIDCLEHLVATEHPARRARPRPRRQRRRDHPVAKQVRADFPDRPRHREPRRTSASPAAATSASGNLDDVDYVALVNNDATVPPDWLQPLLETLAIRPDARRRVARRSCSPAATASSRITRRDDAPRPRRRRATSASGSPARASVTTTSGATLRFPAGHVGARARRDRRRVPVDDRRRAAAAPAGRERGRDRSSSDSTRRAPSP